MVEWDAAEAFHKGTGNLQTGRNCTVNGGIGAWHERETGELEKNGGEEASDRRSDGLFALDAVLLEPRMRGRILRSGLSGSQPNDQRVFEENLYHVASKGAFVKPPYSE